MTMLYLVVLEGQGSTYTYLSLVDEVVWDWLSKPYAVDADGVDLHIPDSIRDKLDGEGFISQGTWHNDRALQAPNAELDGKKIQTFYSVMKLIDFVKANNIEILDEYQGCIY